MASRKAPKPIVPRLMEEVTREDYFRFLKNQEVVRIEDVNIELHWKWEIRQLSPPKDYRPETFTVWSFPDRGDWATHTGNYRGNWSPYIPRNLILRYSEPGETVLDQMMGSGTTLIECKLLGRNAIGVDINRDAVMVARDRLNFPYRPLESDFVETWAKTYVGDARSLGAIENESVDLIATHPPYASIISYTKRKVDGDISKVRNVKEFVEEIGKVAAEAFRVLKPNRHCAILIGDTRRHKHFVPIAVRVMQSFLEHGFILREDITKVQWNMKSTREKWRGSKYDFYLLGHEHLYVFRKPDRAESVQRFKESMRWWPDPPVPAKA